MRNGPYLLVIAPDTYPGKKYRGRYVYEHHLVWWQETGEVVDTSVDLVHHVDGDKHNNSFSNLVMKARAVHTAEHNDKERTYLDLTCAFCGNKFKREVRQVRTKVKNGQTDFYCNRSCASKHFGCGRKK